MNTMVPSAWLSSDALQVPRLRLRILKRIPVIAMVILRCCIPRVNSLPGSFSDLDNDCLLPDQVRGQQSPNHAGVMTWLLALPISDHGLKLIDDGSRIATRLYALGPIYFLLLWITHTAFHTAFGSIRTAMHALLKDILCRCLTKTGVQWYCIPSKTIQGNQ